MPNLAVLFLLVTFVEVPGFAQDQNAGSVRIVTTGQILKVDSGKKTFQFRIALDAFPPGSVRARNRGARRGQRGRGNEILIPTIEVKVFLNDADMFSRLRVGDRVSLTGVRRGKGREIDALRVVPADGSGSQ